jgi:hypothetical protein
MLYQNIENPKINCLNIWRDNYCDNLEKPAKYYLIQTRYIDRLFDLDEIGLYSHLKLEEEETLFEYLERNLESDERIAFVIDIIRNQRYEFNKNNMAYYDSKDIVILNELILKYTNTSYKLNGIICFRTTNSYKELHHYRNKLKELEYCAGIGNASDIEYFEIDGNLICICEEDTESG